MVESIWWTDGISDFTPPLWDEVGEGWQVIGSESAMNQIQNEYPGLELVTYCLRNYTKDGVTERNEKLTQGLPY